MCGIFCCFHKGNDANSSCTAQQILEKCSYFIQRRGPDVFDITSIEHSNHHFHFAASILWLQGSSITKQPLTSDNSIFVYNGDIFRSTLITDEQRISKGDTALLFNLLDTNSPSDNLIKSLSIVQGPYALIYLNKATNKLYFGRDIYGRRSLLIGIKSNVFVLSSVASKDCDIDFLELPAIGTFCYDLLDNKLEVFPWKYKNKNFKGKLEELENFLKIPISVNQVLPLEEFEQFRQPNESEIEEIIKAFEELGCKDKVDKRSSEEIGCKEESNDKINSWELGCEDESNDNINSKELYCKDEVNDKIISRELCCKDEANDKINCQELGCEDEANDKISSQELGCKDEANDKICSTELSCKDEVNDKITSRDLDNKDKSNVNTSREKLHSIGNVNKFNVGEEADYTELSPKNKDKLDPRRNGKNRKLNLKRNKDNKELDPNGSNLHCTALGSSKLNSFDNLMENLLKNQNRLSKINDLKNLLKESVSLRISTQPKHCHNCIKSKLSCKHPLTGVLFSGGLDCTILALLADYFTEAGRPIDLINVAFDRVKDYNTPDRLTAKQSFEELIRLRPDRSWNLVEVNVTSEELNVEREKHVRHLIFPLNTILDDSLGCALWFASRGSTDGYKSPCRVLLVGMGADELFGGYTRHGNALKRQGWSGLHETLNEDWQNLSHRNLARDDRVVSDHGRQLRTPYLDEKFVEYVRGLNSWEKTFPGNPFPKGVGEKILLRMLAYHLGLRNAAFFEKRALQFGSKIANNKENGTDVSPRL